ncbi:hypothetical protein [Streptomyces boluensis]|uniref:Uncharacterized protein n=1 Tax=Streptomyces boluensis TaxID=1775135 RepID=A0A964UL10_9ACTN|nr:hypothetical protein [Streptomyces boluensis]NBE50577.1 hypothetical protein [Streptomyces boluensis]
MAPHTSPQPLTPGWLSIHFDDQPFPARTSSLAGYARTLAPDAYAALHRTLDAGTVYERHTALFLAVARRDLPTVGAALADPVLRRRALSAAIRLPVPEEPLERLALNPARAVRHDTYRVLRLSRRDRLAARLLPRVHERYGADDAARLLPACPSATVDTWLPRLDPPHGVLRTLTRTAPLAVARLIAARYAQLTPQDRSAVHSFGRHHRDLASIAAIRDPEAALVLVRAVPHLLDGRAAVAVLRQPAAALDALRAARPPGRGEAEPVGPADRPSSQLRVPPGPLPKKVRTALHRLAPDDLIELAEHCADGVRRQHPGERQDVAPDSMLMLLPPAERLRIVTRRAERLRGGFGALPVRVLAALEPADRAPLIEPLRQRWARRHRRAARYAVVLPLSMVEPLLIEMAGQHRLHDRYLAWPTLLACAELNGDPAEFARIAALCERAWHDRDEIRRHTLTQLAGAAAELLRALPRQVLRDAALTAVQSRDSSSGTLTAAGRLLRRSTLAQISGQDLENAAYSAGLLCQVLNDTRHPLHASRRYGTESYRSSGGRRSGGAVQPLPLDTATAQALWAAISVDATPHTRENPALCVTLAELLAPHLERLPDLDRRVHDIALTSTDPTLAARAAGLWVAPSARREQRCAELIAQDVSFADVPRVLHTLATRRTDLLDPVIAAATDGLTGHLRPRATPWVPCVAPAVTGRWLPRQRRALNEHYARVARDEDVPLHTRADAASRLRTPELLTGLADEAPQPVAAAALGALGVTASVVTVEAAPDAEEPADESIACLLRHTGRGGVRGRAAMAALRQVFGTRPADEAVTLLGSVLTDLANPVGSRKEAARALGELPDAAAFDALLTAWDVENQHRDVRAVLAQFLVARVDRPDIADRLVPCLDEPALREVVLHTRVVHDLGHASGSASGPVSGPAHWATAYTAFLIRVLHTTGMSHDAVATACRTLAARSVPDPEAALRALAEVLLDPARAPREWRAAAEALLRVPAGPVGTPTVTAVLDTWRRLVSRARDAESPLRADMLRRLTACAELLSNESGAGHGGGGASLNEAATTDGLADALESVGLHARAARARRDALAAELCAGKYRPERWDRFLQTLERHNNPWGGVYAIPGYVTVPPPAAFLTAAKDLRERGSVVAARFALALVRIGGQRSSWTADWRSELDALRAHEDAETALEAELVSPDES